MALLIDLFCGCGGLSLGSAQAGLPPRLAVDMDRVLTSTFSCNHPSTELWIADVARLVGADIEAKAGGPVLGVLGGPPCQAFSEIGQRREDDPRRSLLGHFFRLVSELAPAFFVMENVKGLGYAGSRRFLEEGLNLLPGTYDVLGPIILDAADFGAATTRPRLFVFGFQRSRCTPLRMADLIAAKSSAATVQAAVSDLQRARFVGMADGFDEWKIASPGRPSRYASRLRSPTGLFTGHARTEHSKAVRRRFGSVPPGGRDAVGRHARLSWDGQCPTLCAGTGADHGKHQSVRPIHPDEDRVITVREAARLQGFPNSFRFHPTRWHSFRMIGNSVSPVMARVIMELIGGRVDDLAGVSQSTPTAVDPSRRAA